MTDCLRRQAIWNPHKPDFCHHSGEARSPPVAFDYEPERAAFFGQGGAIRMIRDHDCFSPEQRIGFGQSENNSVAIGS